MTNLVERLREDSRFFAEKVIGLKPNQLIGWQAADRIEELERQLAELRNADRPEFNSTDGAHPAWWRGCDHGYAKGLERCAAIAEREYRRHCTGSGFDSQPARSTAYSILQAIRALPDSTPTLLQEQKDNGGKEGE